MRNRNLKGILRPSPALVVAFVALFAAMGGFGYAAVKMKPNTVKTKNIRDGAVTTNKIADGAVTTAKLSPDAVAPNAANAVTAATPLDPGSFLVKVWNNSDAQFVDGKTFSLIAF